MEPGESDPTNLDAAPGDCPHETLPRFLECWGSKTPPQLYSPLQSTVQLCTVLGVQ